MSEELKKAFTLPVTIVFGVLGSIGTIYGIITIFKRKLIRISIIICILLSILIGSIIKLCLLVKKLEKENADLFNNNKGLIEAKDNYLEENILLTEKNDQLLNEAIKYRDESNQLRERLRHAMMCILDLDTGIDTDRKIKMRDYILGGTIDGQRELEGNKDN